MVTGIYGDYIGDKILNNMLIIARAYYTVFRGKIRIFTSIAFVFYKAEMYSVIKKINRIKFNISSKLNVYNNMFSGIEHCSIY